MFKKVLGVIFHEFMRQLLVNVTLGPEALILPLS